MTCPQCPDLWMDMDGGATSWSISIICIYIYGINNFLLMFIHLFIYLFIYYVLNCIELFIHIISYPIFIGYSAMPPPYIPTPQLQPSTKKWLVNVTNVSYTYCACKSTRNTTIMLTWVGSTVLGTCAAKRRLAARAEGARPCRPLSKPMAS